MMNRNVVATIDYAENVEDIIFVLDEILDSMSAEERYANATACEAIELVLMMADEGMAEEMCRAEALDAVKQLSPYRDDITTHEEEWYNSVYDQKIECGW